MSEYLVTDTQLTNVANAIRTKGNTNSELVWPNGYISAINSLSPDEVNLQDRIVTPSASNQYISADSEYDGLGTVMVSGSPNLIADNIKKNVNIFGVTGTYEVQNIGVDTSDANATATDILETKTAYVNNVKITGGIPVKPAAIYTPSSQDQIIMGGQYLTGSQTIIGDENLIPQNIAHGVQIFGIEGTYSGDNNSVNVSDTTATRNDVLAGKIFYTANKQRQTGTIQQKNGDSIIVNRNVITIPAGYYPVQSLTNMELGSVSTPYIVKNRISEHTIEIIPHTDVTSGYVDGAEKVGQTTIINANELVSGTKTITESGLSDVADYEYVNVDIALDSNLTPGNIKKDVVIYGVTGVLDSNGIDTSNATAAAADIYLGKTAYINGDLVTGTMPIKTTATYIPSATDQTITAGQYLAGDQIIVGDANLIPQNIAKDVSIFGITGTHQGGINVSDTTATAADVLPTADFYSAFGEKTTGTMPVWTDVTFDDDKVIIPEGYHSGITQHQIPLGEVTTITATKGTVNDNTITITPSTTVSAGYINSDTYTGDPVTVTANELVSGTRTIDTDGVYDVTNFANVNVNVVPTSGSATTPDTTITVNPNIVVDNQGVITATVSGSQNVTPTVAPGYILSGTAGTVSVTGSNTANLTTQGAQLIAPSTSNQTISSGQYLTGDQTIEAVTLSNLTAQNIKNGVRVKVGSASDDDSVANILGTYTPTLQNRTVTPTNANQNITAASGYDGLGQVTVQGIVCSNLTAGNIADGVTIKIGTSTDDDSVITVTGTHAGINTSDATATASDILYGKTAYVKGSKITGNIQTRSGISFASNTPLVTGQAGYYPNGISASIPIITDPYYTSLSSRGGTYTYYNNSDRVQKRAFSISIGLKYFSSAWFGHYYYGFLDLHSHSGNSSPSSISLGSITLSPYDVTEGTLTITENSSYIDCSSYRTAVIAVPHPVLNTPTLSLTDNILTITNPATNGNFVTGYRIYIDNVLNTTVSNTTINLDNLDGLVTGHNSITVKAIGTYFDDSPMSSAVDYEILSGRTITFTNSPQTTFCAIVGATTYYDTFTVPVGTTVSFYAQVGSSGHPISYYLNNTLVSSGEGAGGSYELTYEMTVTTDLTLTFEGEDSSSGFYVYINEISGYTLTLNGIDEYNYTVTYNNTQYTDNDSPVSIDYDGRVTFAINVGYGSMTNMYIYLNNVEVASGSQGGGGSISPAVYTWIANANASVTIEEEPWEWVKMYITTS